MSNALAKINARVKVLAKKHPNSKRTSLQKQAGREYRAGKLGRVKKKTAKKIARRRVAGKKVSPPRRRKVGAIKNNRDTTDRKNTTITIGTVSGHVAAAKRKLLTDIGTAEAAKFGAKNKTAKRKIERKIREKKSLYRKLC